MLYYMFNCMIFSYYKTFIVICFYFCVFSLGATKYNNINGDYIKNAKKRHYLYSHHLSNVVAYYSELQNCVVSFFIFHLFLCMCVASDGEIPPIGIPVYGNNFLI